eukprot:gene14885-17076_t
MLSVSAFRGLGLTRFTTKRFAVTSTAIGERGAKDYRISFTDNGKNISPWHDIPLRNGDHFNIVIEIPKNTKAKLEISTKTESNPIKQDIKDGKLRDYHGPIYWNYGAFPQTWEDPNVLHPEVGFKGDNDPLDLVEIGSTVLEAGSVHKAKVLGVLAMIDDGELDWKVITVRTEDPLASVLNDVPDIEKHLPGTISGLREWFRWYKTPDNKPLNKFGYNEAALPRKAALEVIEETHHYWQDLRAGKTKADKLWVK